LVATLIAGALYAWQPWQNEGGVPTTFEPGSKTNALLHASQTINPASIRRMEIEAQAGQSAYSAVIFGDSIVEFAALKTLCGAPVLNAGVASAKIDNLTRFAPSIVQSSKAQTVIIAVGVNDTGRQIETTTTSFTSSYRHLIQSLNHLGSIARRPSWTIACGELILSVAGLQAKRPFLPVHRGHRFYIFRSLPCARPRDN
jgi:hypothetical protein